jgi:hypothetical protein
VYAGAVKSRECEALASSNSKAKFNEAIDAQRREARVN